MSAYSLLSMEQVSKNLGVSLKTVYRWIDAGDLPVSKIGRRTYRIFEKDLINFIYSKKVKKTARKKSKKR